MEHSVFICDFFTKSANAIAPLRDLHKILHSIGHSVTKQSKHDPARLILINLHIKIHMIRDRVQSEASDLANQI